MWTWRRSTCKMGETRTLLGVTHPLSGRTPTRSRLENPRTNRAGVRAAQRRRRPRPVAETYQPTCEPERIVRATVHRAWGSPGQTSIIARGSTVRILNPQVWLGRQKSSSRSRCLYPQKLPWTVAYNICICSDSNQHIEGRGYRGAQSRAPTAIYV